MIERYRRKRIAEINVVPYIDVMLVLLVIFMITAPLLTPGVQVDLPQATAATLDNPDRETLIVTVDRRGNLFLDDRAIDAEALGSKVATILRLRPQTPVLVRGDREAKYDAIIQAMVLLQAAGAPSVGLVTEGPAAKK
jgi:biopolymer transport protein TolR